MKNDEEGESGRRDGSADDFEAAGEFAGGQCEAMGKDERAPGGLPPLRFVSGGDGGSSAVGKANVDR